MRRSVRCREKERKEERLIGKRKRETETERNNESERQKEIFKEDVSTRKRNEKEIKI